MVWVFFLKEKSEVLYTFKSFKILVENESDLRIKCLRLDRGGEFTSNDFNGLCEKHGIKKTTFSCKNSTIEWICRKKE